MNFSSSSSSSSSQHTDLIPVTNPRWEGGLIYYENQHQHQHQHQQLMFENTHSHNNNTDVPLEASPISSSSTHYNCHPHRHHDSTIELIEASPESVPEKPASFDQDEGRDTEGGGRGAGAAGSSTSTGSIAMEREREHMFDKVVTPSDVGKLNRLVIPKQHAEKYFPLDSSTNDKGLLLNFEDRSGKSWRFRYSYWNSSQSYVMTKGWSRFVKEKKLDAGDVVSFQRGVGELGKDKFYIDWRRRPDAPPPLPLPLAPAPPEPPFLAHHHHQTNFNLSLHHRSTIPPNWTAGPLVLRPLSQTHLLPPSMAVREQAYSHMIHPQYPNPNHNKNHYQHHWNVVTDYGMSSSNSAASYCYGNQYHHHHHQPQQEQACPPESSSMIYLQRLGAPQEQPQGRALLVKAQADGGGAEPTVFESVPVVQAKGKGKAAAAKRLRLFGVNMDCPISQADECDILSCTTTTPTRTPAMDMDVNLESGGRFCSSDSSSIPNEPPNFQLRLYNGAPVPTVLLDFLADDKGKSSSSHTSLDLDI
ncbi:hypothetical protein Ancab_016014 [Ancistrocladus abbreviatus]